MLNQLNIKCLKTGLKANFNQTEILASQDSEPLAIDKTIIEIIDTCIYLGNIRQPRGKNWTTD